MTDANMAVAGRPRTRGARSESTDHCGEMRMTNLTEAHTRGSNSPPTRHLTLGQLLEQAAKRAPDRLALIAGVPDPAARRHWTYAELLKESLRTAKALRARFKPGERVAVWAQNIPEWVMCEFGCAFAGVVLVTVNPA